MMFSFIVIAIMLNMFIAIVMNAYDDYKMEDSDLFGFYDIKISLIMFVTKTSKSLSVMEKIYTENKTLSLPHADFLHFVGDACHETSTGGYYPPDVKNVVKYIDIILYHDETLKKFEKQYFYENSCKLKFQRLVRRRMKTLGLTKSSEFVLASGTAPRNKPGNGSDGTLVATTQMVNDALAADNSELMSKGLTKTKPAKKESNETSPSGPSNSQ